MKTQIVLTDPAHTTIVCLMKNNHSKLAKATYEAAQRYTIDDIARRLDVPFSWAQRLKAGKLNTNATTARLERAYESFGGTIKLK